MANPERLRRGSAPTRKRRIWLDGELVPWDEARVHVLSHAIQRGALVFDYLSVHETPRGRALFRLDDHLARFHRSLEWVGLPLARTPEEVRAAVLETVRANPGATAVKFFAFVPSIEVEVVPMDEHVVLAVAAYDPIREVILAKSTPPPFHPELRVRLERERRRVAAAIPPQAKVSANYLGPMIAKWKARRAGYDEILLLDEEGFLAEAPTSNLFFVDPAWTLCTPAPGPILEGVTRSSILELAKHAGYAVREGRFAPEALFEAREAFLTGTTAGVWPIVSVDDRPLGDGKPGPVARDLGERFERATSGREPAFAHWLTWVDES